MNAIYFLLNFPNSNIQVHDNIFVIKHSESTTFNNVIAGTMYLHFNHFVTVGVNCGVLCTFLFVCN